MATAEMTKAHAGRSSYLAAAQLAGVVDPGAVAIAVIFETAASILAHGATHSVS
jgi:dihydroxyacetone kinase